MCLSGMHACAEQAPHKWLPIFPIDHSTSSTCRAVCTKHCMLPMQCRRPCSSDTKNMSSVYTYSLPVLLPRKCTSFAFNGFLCIDSEFLHRSVRCMRARQQWTGWSKNRSAASPSHLPPPPAHGRTISSTSLTPLVTWTSPWRYYYRAPKHLDGYPMPA